MRPLPLELNTCVHHACLAFNSVVPFTASPCCKLYPCAMLTNIDFRPLLPLPGVGRVEVAHVMTVAFRAVVVSGYLEIGDALTTF